MKSKGFRVGCTFQLNDKSFSILLVETEVFGWTELILYDHEERLNCSLECHIGSGILEKHAEWVYQKSLSLEQCYRNNDNVPTLHTLFQEIKEQFLTKF